MRSDRNQMAPQMMPFPAGMPTNMMMFPNYMNDNYSALENRVSALEKKVKTLENRISRLETPYQNNNMNNQGFQTTQTPAYQTNQNNPSYQTTQNNPGNYQGEMYMM